MLQHVTFANVPEVFPTGARISDLLYDLAIAYVGAFAFYLLNIRLPLRRDRRAMYRNVAPMVGMVVTHAKVMMTKLNKAASIEPPDRENTWPNVEELCKKINLQTHIGGIYVAEGGGFGTHTVFSVIVDHMRRTQAGIEKNTFVLELSRVRSDRSTHGESAKALTGIDDHSRMCVCARLWPPSAPARSATGCVAR